MVEPSPLLFFFTLHLLVTVVISGEFTIVNNCNYTVWPASSTTSGNATLATTGFILKPGENSTITAPPDWAGRFWGRTLCATNSISRNFSCVTGDCGSGKVACDGRSGSSPMTIAEFSLDSVNNQAFYDISLVDGYNIPMEVIPLGGSGKCNSTSCPTDLNTVCPSELKVTKNGTVVACHGPCAAFNLQFFCCVGNHSTPNTCEPSVYAQIFKTTCPQAYSYVYDNKTSTFACPATDYNVVFCPATNNDSLESFDQGVSVSVGESLTAGNETTRWLSPSGDFAFGFYQLPDDFFLLAIWYDKIQDDAIIWYANGDNPAPKGSRLILNDSRGLVLTNPQGLELWRSDFTGTISNGLMNDVGNFQLRDKNNVTVWDSFSHPTDTLVPNQVMELNGNLFSRQGALNFSHGRFKFHLQEDGNLVLNVINLPSNYSYDPYYKSGTSDAENQTNAGQRLIFDKSGFLNIEKIGGDNFSISNLNVRFSTDEFYYKATINYDGVFTISVYPKDPKRGQSWVIAKTIPENICWYSTFRGEGVCGFNSICTITNDQRPNCTCPDEYSPIDSNNMYAGCIPNFQVICQAGWEFGSTR